jgi:NAD(P)-dependent dehydrogenase (short-subunit alcohol dehydrogenase family)
MAVEVGMRGVAGLRVLVTGAGGGIGQAIIDRLRAESAAVAATDLVDVDDHGAESFVTGDVTDPDDVERVVRSAIEALGGLDGLVACAGIHWTGPTHEMAPDDFRRVVDVSVLGTFLSIRACLTHFLAEGHGRIVTLGSTAALVGAPGLSAYAVAKGGVLQLTRSVAAEYASRGIRANCLCPGATDTPLLRRLMADRADPEAFAKMHPIGRFARPDEIAGTAVYLLSDDASYMTGSAVTADGGFTAI